MAYLPPWWSTTNLKYHLNFGNPASATMSPGSIYYLPPICQIPASALTSKMIMTEGIFCHPVLIMSVDERRSEASILIITSARGKAFRKLHPNLKVYGVPIWPNDPHPLNNSLVYLKNQWALPKECFINTIRQYQVPCCVLKPLFCQKNHDQFQLRDDSFAFIESCRRGFSSPSSSSSSSRSLRSSSSASSISSLSSDGGGVRLSPFLSSPATPTSLIRYSATQLLALRPGSNLSPAIIPSLRTPDFDLLSPSHRCVARKTTFTSATSPSSSPEPSTPIERLIDDSSSTPSSPAWRSSRTHSVSNPHHQQQPQYIDAQDLDLYFPSKAATNNAPFPQPSYLDAEELDAYFPSSTLRAATDRPIPARRQLAADVGGGSMRWSLHTGSSPSAPPPLSNAFSSPFSSAPLVIHYSTLRHNHSVKIDMMTTCQHYSGATYAVTTYLVTTDLATGFVEKKVVDTRYHWA
ncbi:MAG: hypothetical protein LQ339_006238 [Xanthoria mediterranea]|nr:MAG: hypothetical protein LQ339_006238 [Xanthoria mediterranea]